jgi:D-lyxose ketol-isomerase
MMTKTELRTRPKRAAAMSKKAAIVISRREASAIEAADFGLGMFERVGLGVLVYVNTERCCAKELALWPRQTCPEHRHPPVGPTNPGKEETFRCRWGTVYPYVPGPRTPRPKARPPKGREPTFTVWHEVILTQARRPVHAAAGHAPLVPGRPEGRGVSEFSTGSLDELDVFTDPGVQRITEVVD